MNQNTQTWLSFPSQIPPDVEAMLLKYGLIEQLPTEGIKVLVKISRVFYDIYIIIFLT